MTKPITAFVPSTHRKEHTGNGHGFMNIKTEDLFLVGMARRCPLVVVLLRTEEVHDVSATSGPVVRLVEIHVKNMSGVGEGVCDSLILDLDMNRLAAFTAPGFDVDILPEGKRRPKGIDGAHGGKPTPVL